MRKIIYLIIFTTLLLNTALCDTTDVTNNIISDTTWFLSYSPYRVKNEIIISNGATLTVEAGVVVLFDSDAGLRIGKSGNNTSDAGAINAFGFTETPITFTALNNISGSWKGLVFDNGSDNGTNSSLRYCTIEYGGQANIYNVSSNIYCNKTISPTLDYCTIQFANGSEIILENSSPLILHSTIIHTDTGLASVVCTQNSSPAISNSSIESDSSDYIFYADSLSNPVFTGNSFSSSNAKSCRVGILSEFSGNNFINVSKKGIELWGGTINDNRVWSKQLGDTLYKIFESDIIVENNPAVTLTISEGLEIQFSECGLRIGGSASTERGKLVAIGKSSDSIYFTNADGANWRGIIFDNGSDVTVTSSMKYCVIENASSNNIYNTTANIYCIKTGTPEIDSSSIRNSSGYEMYSDNSSASILNSNLHSINKGPCAIYLRNISSANFTANIITSDSTTYIALSDSSSQAVYQNNIFRSANAKSLKTGILSQLVNNNFTFVNKKGIEIIGGTLNTQHLWSVQNGDSVYVIVESDIQISTGITPVLTLDSGITIKLLNVGIRVGGSTSSVKGSLIANGTRNYPVIFTSVSGGIGGWKGIIFDNSSDLNANSLLQYCKIFNAGLPNSYNINANIYCRNTNAPLIRNSEIYSSAAHGIYTITSSPVIQNSKIYNNIQSGIFVGSS